MLEYSGNDVSEGMSAQESVLFSIIFVILR